MAIGWTEAEYLRRLLGERVPTGGADTDTFFAEGEIQSLLNANPGNMIAAVAAGWDIKAAHLAALHDLAEGQTNRKLSQRFAHAERQRDYWRKQAGNIYDTAGITRSVGAVAVNTLGLSREELEHRK